MPFCRTDVGRVARRGRRSTSARPADSRRPGMPVVVRRPGRRSATSDRRRPRRGAIAAVPRSDASSRTGTCSRVARGDARRVADGPSRVPQHQEHRLPAHRPAQRCRKSFAVEAQRRHAAAGVLHPQRPTSRIRRLAWSAAGLWSCHVATRPVESRSTPLSACSQSCRPCSGTLPLADAAVDRNRRQRD